MDGKAQPVAEVADRKWRVSPAPARCAPSLELEYKGWKIGGQTVDLDQPHHPVGRRARLRSPHHHLQRRGLTLVTGLPYKSATEDLETGHLRDRRARDVGTAGGARRQQGANGGLPDENLGVAVLVAAG